MAKLVDSKSCGRKHMIGAEDSQDTLALCAGSCRATNRCGFVSYFPSRRICRRFSACTEDSWEGAPGRPLPGEEGEFAPLLAPSSYAVVWYTPPEEEVAPAPASRQQHQESQKRGSGAKEEERADGGVAAAAADGFTKLVEGKACQDRHMIGYQEVRDSPELCATSCRRAAGCGFISFFPMFRTCRRYRACPEDSWAAPPGNPGVQTYRVQGGKAAAPTRGSQHQRGGGRRSREKHHSNQNNNNNNNNCNNNACAHLGA